MREFLIPEGKIVKTQYVPVKDVYLGCHDRMAVGDVKLVYDELIQTGPKFPCPFGEWHGNRFMIIDGRHEFLAYVMLGYDHILVSWLCED